MRSLRVPALLALTTALSCGSEDSPYVGKDIELRVDTLGITHVYALTDEGAMTGAGYAMARDRLFQMEVNRRRARGTLAELLGSAKIKDDKGARAFRFAALGAADVARMRKERPRDARLLDAWAKGINLRLDELRRGRAPRPYGLGNGPGELDFVPENWSAEDGASVGKLLGFGLSSTLDSEVLASAVLSLQPDFAAKYPLVLPAFDAFPLPTGKPRSLAMPPPGVRALAGKKGAEIDRLGPLAVFGESLGSNNWAIAADRTDTGRPLLAGDPHQAFSSPIRLWPVHMSSVAAGGTLDVIGFAFVGTPSVELGHNARVGWTATTAFADVMDILSVRTNEDGDKVLLAGQEVPIVERKEVIRVRGADGRFGEEEVTLRDVPGKGVLLPDDLLPVPPILLGAKNILFMWTGFEPTLEGSAYLDMDRAKNVAEWEKAVDVIEVGAQNFVGADAKDVSYHVALKLPDRGAPGSHPMPWHLLPGDSPDVLWSRGFLGADKLPRDKNPARGWLATANTDPFGFTADGNVENDPYYYGAFFANGMRLVGIQSALEKLLASGKKITRADMEALQADFHSPMADVIVPRLQAAWGRVATDPALAAYKDDADLGKLVERLVSWDRAMAPTSGDAVVALGVEWFAAKAVTRPGLGDLLFEGIAEKSPPFIIGALRNVLDARFVGSDKLLPAGGADALLLSALADTRAWVRDRFGSTDPTKFALRDLLAAEFPTSFGGRLEVGRTPIGGSYDTINVAPAPFFEKKGDAFVPRKDLACTEMAMYRMVIGFDDDGTPRATFDFARGTREDPDSPHFGDRQADWAAGKHVPLWFRRDEVEAHTEEKLVLTGAD